MQWWYLQTILHEFPTLWFPLFTHYHDQVLQFKTEDVWGAEVVWTDESLSLFSVVKGISIQPRNFLIKLNRLEDQTWPLKAD